MALTQRIVSLLPSSTEIVCALGCSDRLVGRSHECDYPASVIDLPACSEAKFDPDGTSYEIDQRVKAVLQEAVSVYRVHATVRDELEPDLLVTQSQCEVCAVSLADGKAAACQLVKSQPKILSLAPNALADIWRDIGAVAKASAVEEKGAASPIGEALILLCSRSLLNGPRHNGSTRTWPPWASTMQWPTISAIA